MGKLILHIVENGHSHNLDCDECTIVQELHKMIESFYGIPVNDQLLLCLGEKMDPQNPLSAYKLPSDEGEVFLFNKSRMRSNSPNPEPEQVRIVEVPDPPIACSSHARHPLDDASDPALKALPSYEKEFRYHFQCGKAIYSRALVKFEACESLLGKQEVQERAMEIARGNVNHFYSMIVQNYTDFDKCYSQQYDIHTNLLKNFQRDVDKLKAMTLIPSLQRDNRKCLFDLVNEESLQKAAVDSSSSRKQFDSKVYEFKQEFGDLKRSAEQLFSERPVFIRGLDLSIKEHQQHINELKSIMQSLSNDVNTVKKLLDDCVSPQLSSSLRPHDAVSALGPIYENHKKKHLPRMGTCESEISSLLNLCEAKKNEMNMFVHNYMQKVACIQYTIKGVRYKFSMFQEALKHQDAQFEQLRIVCGIGYSYRACLAEVARRKAAMKIYMGKAGRFAEELAVDRDAEIRTRDEFLKIHSNYIPGDVLGSMGLYDSPSPCDFNVVPFDTNLVDIDIYEIDRYAPESVLEKCGSELVEISGTSKIEVENAKLKAELASKIVCICLMRTELNYEFLDRTKLDKELKNAAEKTSQALNLKDEYHKHLQILLKDKQVLCESYEKRIQELEQRLSDEHTKGLRLSADVGLSCGVKSENLVDRSSVHEPEHDKRLERSDQMVDSSTILNPQPDDIGDENKEKPQGKTPIEPELDAKADIVPQNALAENSNVLDNAEIKIMELNEEIAKLRTELEMNRKLLDESQVNCTHLKNCLHEAREEAHRHLSTVDRRASDYSVLHASSIKIRNLFGRLRTCVLSATVADFSDSLRSLAQSLASSASENEDDSAAEFLECVTILSDKVEFLSMQHKEFLDRSLKLESANEQLNKELNEKTDLVSTLYKKHQLEKQANKEKISFGRLELHEIAAFILNPSGHYEAINRTCPYYYLSDESVALFTDRLSIRPPYIVGQVVHIERQVVKSSTRVDMLLTSDPLTLTSNPYGVPVGCEYFVVTVAMLPEINVASASAFSS